MYGTKENSFVQLEHLPSLPAQIQFSSAQRASHPLYNSKHNFFLMKTIIKSIVAFIKYSLLLSPAPLGYVSMISNKKKPFRKFIQRMCFRSNSYSSFKKIQFLKRKIFSFFTFMLFLSPSLPACHSVSSHKHTYHLSLARARRTFNEMTKFKRDFGLMKAECRGFGFHSKVNCNEINEE